MAALLFLLYALPPYAIAVAELTPWPAAVMQAALLLWPAGAAAACTGVDLARLPWFYAHLPLAYYPYRYPSPGAAALPLAAAAAGLHLLLWRRPRPGWRPSPWSLP
ncbi:MAG: hypothetical protein D6739_07540 [Nitrospirae bacterium]|nr:MAG: hypothetical protein D6739_07540 [Nitrospirota bacterium]